MKVALWLCLAVAIAPQSSPSPVQALRAALGGDAAIAAVASLHVTSKITLPGRTGNGEIYYELPNRFSERTETFIAPVAPPQTRTTRAQPTDPLKEFERLTTPAPASRVGGNYTYTGIADGEPIIRGLPAGAVTDELRQQVTISARRAFARMAIPLFGGNQGATFKEARGKDLIFVDHLGDEWKLTLDSSGRPATLTWHVRPPGSSIAYADAPEWVSKFSDYGKVKGGLNWPHRVITTIDGKPYHDTVITLYEVNGKIPADTFKR